MKRASVWITLTAIVLFGLGLRVWGLHHYYLSPDDLLHLEIASADSMLGVWRNAAEQIHPPLIYFLLHFLEQITLDPIFYRFLPLLPGVALIVALFFLGRTAAGSIAGIAMAYVGAFSISASVLSQVIRPYCLLALLLCVGLNHFILYLRDRERRHLTGYAITNCVGVLLHYSYAIPLLAMSVVWIGRAVVSKESRREWIRILVVTAPPFAALGALYLFHASSLSTLYHAIRVTYLRHVFAADLAEFWGSVSGFFEYMLLDEVWLVGLLLAFLGLYAIWRRSRELALFVVLTFGINFVLTWMQRYPFGPSRHSFYLFPLVALLLGCAVQFLVEMLCTRFGAKMRSLLGRPWVTAVAVAAVLFSMVPVWNYYDAHRFMRRHRYGTAEFPVDWSMYRRLMSMIHQRIGPRDVILASRKSGHYLLFESGYAKGQIHSYRSKELFQFEVGGVDVYISQADLKFRRGDDLRRALRKLGRRADYSATPTVWIPSLGLARDIAAIRKGDPMYADLIRVALAGRGVRLYYMSGRAAQAVLEE